MILTHLKQKEVISPPDWLPQNTVYLTIMGSEAYGTNLDTSDCDYYGVCIPPRRYIFPHIEGYIEGFSTNIPSFDQWLQHHIKDPDGKEKEYDFQVFNIVKYFRLLMDNNPNVLDSLFTDRVCVHHTTSVGNLIRENRHIFLHKGSYYKFIGYAHSQLNKMSSSERTGKRKEVFDKYGFDLKFAMNLVRLALECEQILTLHDLDLRRDREYLKSIRRGDIKEQEIRDWFSSKEKFLEKCYQESTLPYGPDENKIRELLLKCLEHHYGSLAKAITVPDQYKQIIQEISKLCQKVI